MDIVYVRDVKGVHHRFDRFSSYVYDNGDTYEATYVDHDGSVKTATIDIYDWQNAETQAAPLLTGGRGYSVILVAENEQGELVPWLFEVLAWRRQNGAMLPCCIFWKHDEYFLEGMYPTVMCPDGHIETLNGGYWPSLDAYMAERTHADSETKGPPWGPLHLTEQGTDDKPEETETPSDETIH